VTTAAATPTVSTAPAPLLARAGQPRPGSRAARLAHPRTLDVVRQLAAEHGVCARPVSLRRTDLDTGVTELVDLPCGATREDKCPACAARARRLRMQQIREGWHLSDEPLPPPGRPSSDQVGLVIVRGHLEFDRAQTLLRPMPVEQRERELADIDTAIMELEEEIAATGLRGHVTGGGSGRRVRSTKRRQDAPNLPRRPIRHYTVGREYQAADGSAYRPSLFLTVTLPSYGRVRSDGTPVDPDRYDYRAAAWDAVHFPRLLDRFWQNLRRAVGWNVQYAGAVEPQRRLAPHAHFAIRGTIPRALLRQVAAATYHQVWWPAANRQIYDFGHLPVWDKRQEHWIDPDIGTPLTSWRDALDEVDGDPHAAPVHVVRFGEQVHAQGVTADSADAERCVRYITKYLTKQAGACHQLTTAAQRAHHERYHAALQVTPCSPRCANWLLYGIQPDHAHAKLRPGRCRSRVHQPASLGLGGRRVLISRQWSGKTLADHRADNRAWVRALLGITGHRDGDEENVTPARYAWELAEPNDPDVPPLGQRLLRAISERIQRRSELQAAQRAGPPAVLSVPVSNNLEGDDRCQSGC
jgi:hypothetical protein